jgi:hypothetical protein
VKETKAIGFPGRMDFVLDGSNAKGVLLRTSLHARPAPKINGRLNRSCGEKITMNSARHMHGKHERKRKVPAELREEEFVWNGESALTATHLTCSI